MNWWEIMRKSNTVMTEICWPKWETRRSSVHIHEDQITKNPGPDQVTQIIFFRYLSNMKLKKNTDVALAKKWAMHVVGCWEKNNLLRWFMTSKYGQTWKKWLPSLSLSLYNTFKPFTNFFQKVQWLILERVL